MLISEHDNAQFINFAFAKLIFLSVLVAFDKYLSNVETLAILPANPDLRLLTHS